MAAPAAPDADALLQALTLKEQCGGDALPPKDKLDTSTVEIPPDEVSQAKKRPLHCPGMHTDF